MAAFDQSIHIAHGPLGVCIGPFKIHNILKHFGRDFLRIPNIRNSKHSDSYLIASKIRRADQFLFFLLRMNVSWLCNIFSV